MRNFRLLSIMACVFTTASLPAEPPARSFDWLSGHWCLQQGGKLTEEYWFSEEGEVALGISRAVEAGRTVHAEFMRIETRDGVTRFIATLEGQSPVPFRLTRAGTDWARFENPQHDFPTRIEYRRTAAGLHAEIAGPGGDGKEQVIPFEYRRCQD